MNCPFCHTPNIEEAENCKNCELKLSYATSYPKSAIHPSQKFAAHSARSTIKDFSDSILLAFILFTLFKTLAQYTLRTFFLSSSMIDSTQLILGVLWLLGSLSFLLIPLAIKDHSKKTIGLIFTALLVIYWSYTNLSYLFSLY